LVRRREKVGCRRVHDIFGAEEGEIRRRFIGLGIVMWNWDRDWVEQHYWRVERRGSLREEIKICYRSEKSFYFVES